MKTTATFLLISLLSMFVSAQDLIYTVSGEFGQEKISLDSILVENLSNNSRILFDNLPIENDYQINLSKKSYWGTTFSDQFEFNDGFVVVTNLPGVLKLVCKEKNPVDAKFSLFSLNGMEVYVSTLKTIEPGQTINFKVGATGMYLAKIETPEYNYNFKVIGEGKNSDYNIFVSESSVSKKILKNTEITFEDFSFTIGDSIRISAYKNGYYAFPAGLTIVGSEPVDFIFKQSTVESTGISDAYVYLDENLTDVTYYNNETGDATITYSGDKPNIAVGAIVTLDLDTTGYLREVIKVEENDGSISIKTVQAAMNDIFVDYELLLNSSLIEAKSGLKSTSNLQEITDALTDEEGYIHPIAIYYEDTNGELKFKSAFESTDEFAVIHLEEEFTKNLYNQGAANLSLNTNASFNAHAVFNLNFKNNDELSVTKKLIKGELKTFEFYIYGTSEFNTELSLDLSAKYTYESDPYELLKIKTRRAKFLVAGVYVWVAFDGGLYAKYEFDGSASLNEKWGFQIKDYFKIGGLYNNEAKDFSPVYEYIPPQKTVFPFETTGDFTLSARFELYPRMEAKLYEVIGPFFELAPFESAKFMAKAYTATSGEETQEFIAWNSGIDLGLDFRTGALLDIFGLYTKECGPLNYNFFTTPIWEAPANIGLKTNLPGEADSAEVITLNFKVVDNLGNGVPGCPVYLEGDGEFGNGVIPSTDAEGEVSINWKLIGDNVTFNFTASIYDAAKNVIDHVGNSVAIKGKDGGGGDGDICDSNWYAAYYEKSIAMTNAGIAYAINQTPQTCLAYKDAIQAVLDELALYSVCDWGEEENESYNLTVQYVEDARDNLDCN